MKDVTFGVKVPQDLRDEINEIMKSSGLVGREFMQQLVDSYQLDRNKQAIPEMAEEIKELQSLTHRINEMYLYLGTRFQNIISLGEKEKKDIDQVIIENKLNHEENIKKYKEQVKIIEEKMGTLKEEYHEMEESKKEINTKLIELTSYNENYKELNEQYKNNIIKLTEELENLKPLKEDNTQLITANKQLQEGNDNLASDLWFAKRENEKLNEQLIKNKKEYEHYLSHLKNQQHLEKQTTVLELQLENQKNVEVLNKKMAVMQQEYHDKLKELLFQMEATQKEKVKGE